MKAVIFANGEYGDLDQYKEVLTHADITLCADGGANYAYAMGIMPDCILGDLDSIDERVWEHYLDHMVEFKQYPRGKDFTDTQLVLLEAEKRGAREIILLGTLGKRLDHTLANIYSGMGLAAKGIKVMHYSPQVTAYLVHESMEINGRRGDTVSVLSLSDEARGVSESGFEYPLFEALLYKHNPYAVCNVMTGEQGVIDVQEGILLVLHYKG